MLTRRESMVRIQVLANSLGRSIPRAALSSLSDKQLRDFISVLSEQQRFARRAWGTVGSQIANRFIARS